MDIAVKGVMCFTFQSIHLEHISSFGYACPTRVTLSLLAHSTEPAALFGSLES